MDGVPRETLVHGTCVALGSVCAILRGPSGAGKSDLALRFLFLPPHCLSAPANLVADDQVLLRRSGEAVVARCPPSLFGRIEVRGLGVMRQKAIAEAELKLLVDLDGASDIPRFPTETNYEDVLEKPIVRLALEAFEASAPIKLAIALQNFLGVPVD